MDLETFDDLNTEDFSEEDLKDYDKVKARLEKDGKHVDNFFYENISKEQLGAWKHVTKEIVIDEQEQVLVNYSIKRDKEEWKLETRIEFLEKVLKNIGNICIKNLDTENLTKIFELVQTTVGYPTMLYEMKEEVL